MKRFILLCCMFFVVMAGCSSKDYKRDSSQGEIITITLEEMQEKLDQGDTFPVAFTTTICSYCQAFHEMLTDYLPNHNITLYEVILDNENRSANENRKMINQNFPEFNATPGIFFVENGKNKNHLEIQSNGIGEAYFDEWVKTFQLDAEKR